MKTLLSATVSFLQTITLEGNLGLLLEEEETEEKCLLQADKFTHIPIITTTLDTETMLKSTLILPKISQAVMPH